MLPTAPPGDPHAGDWLVRRETYHHLLRHVLASGPQPLRVLDLGAGSGWLSHRLAGLGHLVVAVDAIDDEVDGLGAAHHYAAEFGVVQADFNAVPFAAGQFDLVVFNGSLHYAPDVGATLARGAAHPRARRHARRDGLADVSQRIATAARWSTIKLRRFATDAGLRTSCGPASDS